MRILIADDASDAREILGRLLKRWGHEVVTASNGREAWEILRQEPLRLVISDWMMPEIDGLELCRRVREAQWEHYVYFILLTARDDKEDLIEGMTAGADDFLTKSFNFEELRVRLRAAERILSLESQLASRNSKLEETNGKLHAALDRIQQDLRAAAALQASLLPKDPNVSPAVALAWLFLPATEIGGDIFDFFRLNDRDLGFYHLDVAGHGVPSAMMSVTLSRTLSAELGEGHLAAPPADERRVKAPDAVVADLNRRFQSGENAPYFTMVYGYIDTHSGRGELCQAGHPHPLLARHDGRVEQVGHGGFAVGMLEGVPYDSVDFTLESGDRLILYSDGITDCRNAEGESFELERLIGLAGNCIDTPPASLTTRVDDTLRRWRGAGEIEDDISLLVLQRR
ncbi:PP2C family protein-serine/threonine phosphatase [Thiocapsa rosea]|uniref:Sigma-B regulation protein RsbU (Phosphoserine phosphatase) n=1 Tax=Thiocapsa rosea TaxID=69360 RepID=A0A495V7E4_9GAMM|nr:SpoIIE family protein phosphatase [Thiocapsa rosea]RKT44287.1 sigma-B regulation protein RsbU (phosphoserine phosphatase) [Thiocapsa rosea]